MSAIEIAEDLFFVERGYLNANHFVYRGEEPVLIDTAYVSGFEDTAKAISKLGVDLTRIRLIVNTHSHCDHVGGNRIIQERSGCRIALHALGKHFIDSRDDWATWWRFFDQEAEFFTCHKALEHGEVMRIGPHEFEVIYTPGHASDGIVLYHLRDKILLSSDTLWERDMALINPLVEGSRAVFSMAESIGRLKTLDVRMVYPGHGRPFAGFGSAISRAEARLSGFVENRKRIGNDLLKKIIIYTLLMKRGIEEAAFFGHLMGSVWFRQTVDRYFAGNYEKKYSEIMKDFSRRGIVKSNNGRIFTTIKP